MNTSINSNSKLEGTTHPEVTHILAALLGGVLIVFTLIGNSVVCVSFYMFKELRTVCHYFVISLSAADILVALVAMPFWCALQVTSNQWLFGQDLKVFWDCMDILCGTASIMNLTAVSIDRHAAITDPFSYSTAMTPARALSMITFVWLYAVLVSSLKLASWPSRAGYMLFVACASFFLPLFVMTFMYVRIYIVARQHVQRLRSGHNFATDVKAAKTIAILIGLFVICWGPFFAIVLCFAYDLHLPVPGTVINIIKWMEYTSSCMNPIIYTCLNRSYRRAFRKLCMQCRRFRKRSESSTSTASRPKTGGSFSSLSLDGKRDSAANRRPHKNCLVTKK